MMAAPNSISRANQMSLRLHCLAAFKGETNHDQYALSVTNVREHIKGAEMTDKAKRQPFCQREGASAR
jgi:hypothetical protein